MASTLTKISFGIVCNVRDSSFWEEYVTTMKILYAFQGTGNGHAARARALVPELSKFAEVDVATSGMRSELDIGYPIRFRFRGISFQDNGDGQISPLRSLKFLKFGEALRDIKLLAVDDYDLVVNDFEPITAYAARRLSVPSVAVSHQAAFLSPHTPRANPASPLANMTFKWFAPTENKIGFHFQRYDDFILTPILRDEIRQAQVKNDGHITVYLPGYRDESLLPLLQSIERKKFHVFSRQARGDFNVGNVIVRRIDNQSFIHSLVSCDGFLAGAGFEGPAEALHLGKKLMVIPLRGQYEQKCNSSALARLGIPVISHFDEGTLPVVHEWALNGTPIHLPFPDVRPEVIERILSLGTAPRTGY